MFGTDNQIQDITITIRSNKKDLNTTFLISENIHHNSLSIYIDLAKEQYDAIKDDVYKSNFDYFSIDMSLGGIYECSNLPPKCSTYGYKILSLQHKDLINFEDQTHLQTVFDQQVAYLGSVYSYGFSTTKILELKLK